MSLKTIAASRILGQVDTGGDLGGGLGFKGAKTEKGIGA